MAMDIWLKVKNLQEQDGQDNIISYQTRGYLYPKNPALFLKYREDRAGLEGVMTTLKIEGDRVTLIRHGTIALKQIFAIGLTTKGSYQTPYGRFQLTTVTTDLEIDLKKAAGLIRIAYDLYWGSQLSSSNLLKNHLEVVYHKLKS